MSPNAIETPPQAVAADSIIPLCVPHLAGNEWRYLKECIDTNFVSSAGAFVDRLENELVERVGSLYAVATSSGTAALHMALLAVGIQPNEEILVSSLSFIAPANAIRYVGAWPTFIDSEPNYWQMDPARVGDFLENNCSRADGHLRNKTTGRRVRAILPVHLLGHPVDMDPILDLAAKHELIVIEDASQSMGALYKERRVGRLGDIACFSFNGNKVITGGGGGAMLTDNPRWARMARYLSTQARDDAVEYVHNRVGYNYRPSNLHAALVCAQLENFDEHIKAKRAIARRYEQGLADLPGIEPMRQAPWAWSAFWLYTILVDRENAHIDARELRVMLEGRGVQARPLWQPLNLSLAHAGGQGFECEVAEVLWNRGLCLPSSVGLTQEDQSYVIDCISRLIRERAKKSVAIRANGRFRQRDRQS
jgi:perosamine synthetase